MKAKPSRPPKNIIEKIPASADEIIKSIFQSADKKVPNSKDKK